MRLIIMILSLLLLPTLGIAVENGYISHRDGADLRLAPRNNAAISGHLDTKTDVEIIKRDRNWIKVQTRRGGIKGWVPAAAVHESRSTATSKRSSSSFFSSFTSMFRSSGSTQKTAVLGVRGLESDGGKTSDKKTSAKAIQTVEWMDTLNVDTQEVSSFIDEGGLKP